MTESTTHGWDFVYSTYKNEYLHNPVICHKKKINFDEANSTPVCLSENTVYDRLFNDFLKKRMNSKNSELFSSDNSVKHITTGCQSYIVQSSKWLLQNKDESSTLHEVLKNVKNALKKLKNIRNLNIEKSKMYKIRNTALKNLYNANSKVLNFEHSELKPLFVSMQDLTESLIFLSSKPNPKESISMITKKITFFSEQQNLLIAERETISNLEKDSLLSLQVKIKDIASKTLRSILESEDLLELLEKDEEGNPKWVSENSISAEIKQMILDKFNSRSLNRDLLSLRRKIKADINVVALLNFHEIIKLEIQLYEFFHQIGLPFDPINNYKNYLVDNIEKSEWFRNISMTNTLKYQTNLHQDVRNLVQSAIEEMATISQSKIIQ